MLRSIVGFIVYGVHKEGLKDPIGQRFIDETTVEAAKRATFLRQGLISWWKANDRSQGRGPLRPGDRTDELQPPGAGRAAMRTQKTVPELEPGERRNYGVELEAFEFETE